MGKITRIGTLDIVLPDKQNLRFADGDQLRKDMVLDFCVNDLAGDKFKLRILVPDDFEMYQAGGKGPKTYAEFYVGLFESVFEQLRAITFPDLKADANRRKFRTVGDEIKGEDLPDMLQDFMAPAWDTHHYFEQFLLERVKIAMIDTNGKITEAHFDEERMFLEVDLPEAKSNQLFMVSNKFFKGLDSMFLSDFQCRHDFANGEYKPRLLGERHLRKT